MSFSAIHPFQILSYPGQKCTSGSAHIPSSESFGITGHHRSSYGPSSPFPWASLLKAGYPLLGPFYKPGAVIYTVMLWHYWVLATTLWVKHYPHPWYRWRYWELEIDLPKGTGIFKVICQLGHAYIHKGHSQMSKTSNFRPPYSSTYLYVNHHLPSSLSCDFSKGSFEHCSVLVGNLHGWFPPAHAPISGVISFDQRTRKEPTHDDSA